MTRECAISEAGPGPDAPGAAPGAGPDAPGAGPRAGPSVGIAEEDMIADGTDDPDPASGLASGAVSEPASGLASGSVSGAASELDGLIALSIRDGRWRLALGDIAALCREAAAGALAAAMAETGRKRIGEVCIRLTDDAFVRDLNRRWRGLDRATNILSFPSDPGPHFGPHFGSRPGPHPGPDVPFGDLVLGYETVVAECQPPDAGVTAGPPLRDHVRHLVVHGCLHLFGFDHESEAEARRMEHLEIDLLARLGIANPYPDRWPDSSPDRRAGRSPDRSPGRGPEPGADL